MFQKDYHHRIIGYLNSSTKYTHLSENDIVEEITKGVTTIDELNSTLDIIHSSSQESFSAGMLAAKLCSSIGQITIDTAKCRNLHFKLLQADFKRRCVYFICVCSVFILHKSGFDFYGHP